MLAFRIQSGAPAHILQLFAKHAAGCQIYHRYTGDLGDIRNGTGRTGVNLDDIYLIIVQNKLDVNQTQNCQLLGQLLGVINDGLLVLFFNADGWIDGNRVTGMNAGTFHMLHDTRNQDIFSITDGINLNLTAHQILIDQYRIFNLGTGDNLHIFPDILFLIGNFHALTAQNVGRTYQNRITQFVSNLYCFFFGKYSITLGPGDTGLVQDDIELFTVLCRINAPCRRAQNRYTQLFQMSCQIDGSLTAKLYNGCIRLFRVDDTGDILRCQRLEIQAVCRIKVRGYGFRVVVDDDGLTAQLLQCPYGMNRAVVELNALTDTDRTGAKYHNLLLAGCRLDLGFLIKGGVIIGRFCLKFCRTGINGLVYRHACQTAHFLFGQTLNHLIGKAHLLCCQIQRLIQLLCLLQCMLHVNDAHKAMEEPGVNPGNIMYFLNGHDTTAECLTDRENTLEITGLNLFNNFLVAQLGNQRHGQGVNLHFNGPDCLHQRCFKAVGDGHYLTGCLHLGTQALVRIHELIKRPAGELDNTVVQCRLKAGYRLTGNRIGQLIQTIAYGNLCRNLGNRITGCLGSQCGGTGYTGIYFDNRIFKGIRIQGKLYVTAAFNAQLGDDLQCGGTQHLVLIITQGLARCHNNRVAGVHANRVNVFHVADGDDIALAVTHDFVFDFLPACNTFLNQNLIYTGIQDTGSCNLTQLIPGISNTAAGTAQSICRTDDNRQTDFFGKSYRIFYAVNDLGGNDRLMDLLHGILKHLTVFCLVDGGGVGTQQLDVIFIQEAACHQIHGNIQTGLSAQCGQNGVRTFFFDDFLYTGNGHRFNINLICHCLVGHNGCRVGVNQNNLQTFFPQRTACLCACIVKFCCLTDDNRTGAKYHYLMNILTQRHY